MNTVPELFFEYHIEVGASDIDALGHVSNIVYLRWVQEAASAHWAKLSNEAINREYIWVVMRHEIDYLRPALAGEKLWVRTWVGKNEAAKSQRHTEFYNAATDSKIAASVTTWCLLDAVTKRPRRIDEKVLALFR